MCDTQIPTTGSSAPAIRRMFALALASRQTKMDRYTNGNTSCVAVSLSSEETVARAKAYVKFIEEADQNG